MATSLTLDGPGASISRLSSAAAVRFQLFSQSLMRIHYVVSGGGGRADTWPWLPHLTAALSLLAWPRRGLERT